MNRNFLAFVVFIGCVALQALTACYIASVWIPEFYQRKLATSADQLVANAESFEKEMTRLHADAHDEDGRWELSVSDDQINGWLMLDWPQRFPRALPSNIREPRVAIEPGKCNVACQYEDGGTKAVLTMTIDIQPAGKPNQVKLRILSANIGSVSGLGHHAIGMLSYTGRRLGFRMRWPKRGQNPEAIVHIPRSWLDKNRRVQVERITFSDSKVLITGTSMEKAMPVSAGQNAQRGISATNRHRLRIERQSNAQSLHNRKFQESP
jgi:hypothetical protein